MCLFGPSSISPTASSDSYDWICSFSLDWLIYDTSDLNFQSDTKQIMDFSDAMVGGKATLSPDNTTIAAIDKTSAVVRDAESLVSLTRVLLSIRSA